MGAFFMLKALFGCKSVEKILLFLLVNEKCYAQQIHRVLETPLNPLQKGLSRLEKGGIIKSAKEKKMRLYRLNEDFALIKELEMLLKAAFTTLSPQEKKRYYDLYPATLNQKQDLELLQLTWDFLKNVTQVTLVAKSHSQHTPQFNRKGNGKVKVMGEGNTLVFQEQGCWVGKSNESVNYTNSFRWSWEKGDLSLGLEHLRFGENNPIFLFHLTPKKDNRLTSLHSHLCGNDSYFGWLQYNPLFLQLKFKTLGPQKNEEVEYIYT
jgi:DNA-binding transcriptional ArsR family regulator